MKQARRRERVVACLTALALSSCATSPYIANTRPTAPESAAGPALAAAAKGQGLAASALPGTLPYALAYADATYDAYQAKLGEEFTRQQQLSSGLLTLSALTVGAAIGKAHRDVVIAAALGGGLAYQLGTWNSNDGRLGIYLEGMKAMACAKAAVAPLRISDDTRRRMDLSETAVVEALSNAAASLAETTEWLNIAGASQVPNSETSQAARAEITDASAQFAQANDLLKLFNGIGQKVDGAGAMLEPKIDAIRGLIDDALKGTLSKLSSLPQQISSITQYANIFAPGLSLNTTFDDRIAGFNNTLNSKLPTAQAKTNAPAAASPPLEPRAQLAAALGRLRATRVVLAARMAALSGAIERPNSQVQADLATCGVDSTKLTQGISLDRNQIILTAGQAGTSWVSVAGGTMPYTATPMDTPTKGITVAAPAGGAVVMVVADITTVAGSTYKVRVEDSAKAMALLTIKVEAKADPSATVPNQICGGFDAKNSAMTCLVQNVVGAKATGLLDSDTCTRFIKIAPNGQLDDQSKAAVFAAKGMSAAPTVQEILNKLSSDEQKSCNVGPTAEARRKAAAIPKAPSGAPVGAKTAYERSIKADEVLVLSGKLKMQPTTRDLNEKFRSALADYQKRNGLVDTNRELTEPVFIRLMNE